VQRGRIRAIAALNGRAPDGHDTGRRTVEEARSHSATGAALARGAFFNAIAFVASLLRGIFIFLVARVLGRAALGTFGLAWATTDLVSKFGTLGFDTSAIAFVARAEAAGDRRTSRRIMDAALTVSLAACTGLAIGGFWFAKTLGPRFGERQELARATAVTLLALPGMALYRVSNALSRGMAVMHHDIYSRGLTESLGTTAALVLVLVVGSRDLAPEIAAVVGTLASGLVAFALAQRLFAANPGQPVSAASGVVSRLFRASAPIAMYDLLNLGIMEIDVIMLGLFVGRARGVTLETLGIYAAAVEAAAGLRKVSQAFIPIFTPIVARQISAGHVRQAEASYGYLARWMLAILLPLVAVFALAGGAIMTIFGEGFRQGAPWTAIIAAACALSAFVSLGETILMVDRPKVNLVNSSVAFGAAIALNLLLIPRLGPLGAAIAMLVPYTLQGVLRGIEISWIFSWHWPLGALVKPWLAAIAALPLALVLRLWGSGTWVEVAAAVVYLAGYVLAWRLIGLDPNDREVLAHLFRRDE
jgi:O-antigen/teichoic acid export membrane protein